MPQLKPRGTESPLEVISLVLSLEYAGQHTLGTPTNMVDFNAASLMIAACASRSCLPNKLALLSDLGSLLDTNRYRCGTAEGTFADSKVHVYNDSVMFR